MLIKIPGVLSPGQVSEARSLLDAADWVDGKVTAGHQSAKTKNNMQLPESSDAAKKLGAMILAALGKNPTFLSAALPLYVFPPLFNSYAGGQSFGTHVDNAIRQNMASGQRIRTDLSATLFFAEPEEYDGGVLCIEDTYGTQEVKLPAGDMVLYPSTSLHHVTPVTRGARVSSFFWLQSMIRSDEQRTLLYDLDLATQRLGAECAGIEAAQKSTVQLTGVYHNLLRQWAEM